MSVINDLSPPTLRTPDPHSATVRSSPRSGSRGLFRAFWRWHFYASVVVVPVLLMLAVTGLVYLFRFQLEPALHPDLMRAPAHATGQLVQPYQAQLDAVQEVYPDYTVVSLTEPKNGDETTRVSVTTAAGDSRDVFVDPYTTKVLGELDPDSTISGTAVRLHGDLMVGPVGDAVIELGACWAIVMTVTGYYMVVRGAKARRRARKAGAKNARLRSSHASLGTFVGVGLLLLVVSGLPWTGIWGSQAQKLATAQSTSMWGEDPGAQSDPSSTLDESLPHSHDVPWAQGKTQVPSSDPAAATGSVANLDTAVTVADQQGLRHPFTVALPEESDGVYSVIGYAFDDPGQEKTVHVDRYGGQVVSTYGYDDYPVLAKVVAQGISVHEGRRFGAVNMWLTTFFCLAVIASCVTGPLMWWRRRPRGKAAIGAPRGKMPLKASPLLGAIVIALALFLPVFGVSLALVLAFDQLVLRRVPKAAAYFGTAPS